MPDSDFIVNVRQILQYPTKAEADPTDAILIQNGGLGGPYQAVSAYGLVSGALDQPGSDLFINGQLIVAGPVLLQSTLSVASDTNRGGNLFVQGQADFY